MEKRILAVSDIHGYNNKFVKLLEIAKYNPSTDLLIVCGDMIDRGTQNLATIKMCQKLQKQGAIILKGNHEQFAEEAIEDMLVERPSVALQLWVQNGGGNTYDQLIKLPKNELKKILSFIRGLPSHFTQDDYVFAHAGVNPHVPIELNRDDDFIWSNRRFCYQPAIKNKTIIFGHTPTFLIAETPKNRDDIECQKNAKIWFDDRYKDKICIDCGSCYGGRLGLLELPSKKCFYN